MTHADDKYRSNQPSADRWAEVDEWVQSIKKEQVDEMFALEMSINKLPPVSEEVRRQFLTYLAAGPRIAPRKPEDSHIVRWAKSSVQAGWLARVQSQWERIKEAGPALHGSFYSLFQPLTAIAESLTLQLQPAAVYRSATAAQTIYKSQHRSIEAADLPVFSPLFCTAIDPTAGPMAFKGLTPNKNFKLTLQSIGHDGWEKSIPCTADSHGDLQIHLADCIESAPPASEVAWLLAEDTEGDLSHKQWISGLVWMEPQSTHRLQEDMQKILSEVRDEETDEAVINRLIEINLLLTWEHYTKAYELARKSLLYLSSTKEAGSFPTREILWQFIQQIIDAMLKRIQRAEPAFHRLRPDWDAKASLLQLRKSIAAKE